MNKTFTVLQNSGYEFVVFEDIMNKLKVNSSLIFNSDEYKDYALFEKLFKHIQWLHKYGCLSLDKPCCGDNVLISFSCSKPDFVQYELLKRSDFDVKNVLVSNSGEAFQLLSNLLVNNIGFK